MAGGRRTAGMEKVKQQRHFCSKWKTSAIRESQWVVFVTGRGRGATHGNGEPGRRRPQGSLEPAGQGETLSAPALSKGKRWRAESRKRPISSASEKKPGCLIARQPGCPLSADPRLSVPALQQVWLCLVWIRIKLSRFLKPYIPPQESKVR
jgi:hypothetical protein